VSINGQTLPAGEYSFFTIPTENEWTVIFNKNTKLWGSDGYKQEEDALRLSVKPDMNAPFTETMLFAFDNIKIDGADLQLMWANMKLSLRISTDTDTKAIANIKKAVLEAENTYRTYNASATYLLDAGETCHKPCNGQKNRWLCKKSFGIFIRFRVPTLPTI
jgi:hypothetical protein